MRKSSGKRLITESEIGGYIFRTKAWKMKLDSVRPESPRFEAGAACHRERDPAFFG